MKYIDEFRNRHLIKSIITRIKKITNPKKRYRLMEVCGTHTMSIARYGLRDLLEENIELLSGPGCPVCVTPVSFIDKAIFYARTEDVVIATFGDMVKVPGSESSLEQVRLRRGNVKVVYSPMDALNFAQGNPDKKIIFLGVGFETTAPAVAFCIKEARDKKIDNFFVMCGHKVIPPALKVLVTDESLALDGFILPGHVSAIIGSRPYGFISSDYKKACVIAGFEPFDIIQGIYMLVRQILQNTPRVEIQYKRVVKMAGNRLAQKILKEVFELTDSEWRGLGFIPESGYTIRKKYSDFDAENVFRVKLSKKKGVYEKKCICGDILKGKKTPLECRFFGKVCSPRHPLGPCMVSSEGTCSAWYIYKIGKEGH